MVFIKIIKKRTEKITSLRECHPVIRAGGAQVWFGIPYRLSRPVGFAVAAREWIHRINGSNVMRA